MARRGKGGAAEIWRERLERFASVELSVREFCAREGVSEPSFYHWRRRLEDAEIESGRGAAPAAFQEVRVRAVGVLSVEFPGGARLEAPADDVALVRAVVRELVRAGQANGAGEA